MKHSGSYSRTLLELYTMTIQIIVSYSIFLPLKPFYVRTTPAKDIKMCLCKSHLHALWASSSLFSPCKVNKIYSILTAFCRGDCYTAATIPHLTEQRCLKMLQRKERRVEEYTEKLEVIKRNQIYSHQYVQATQCILSRLGMSLLIKKLRAIRHIKEYKWEHLLIDIQHQTSLHELHLKKCTVLILPNYQKKYEHSCYQMCIF